MEEVASYTGPAALGSISCHLLTSLAAARQGISPSCLIRAAVSSSCLPRRCLCIGPGPLLVNTLQRESRAIQQARTRHSTSFACLNWPASPLGLAFALTSLVTPLYCPPFPLALPPLLSFSAANPSFPPPPHHTPCYPPLLPSLVTPRQSLPPPSLSLLLPPLVTFPCHLPSLQGPYQGVF